MVTITAVVPLHRVERYLPDLLRSLDAQDPGPYELDVVFVDDGSPDDSAGMVERWLASTSVTGVLVRQDNAGVSAARNRGMDAATGEWVTFPDSDDLLADDYFAAAARFLTARAGDIDLASARLLRLREPAPVPEDVHALSFRFAGGDRVVSMLEHPDVFQLNVASAFFRLADLRRAGVRFRTGLHASEDALFVAQYLLGLCAPRLGLIASASYVYRRRAARDSAVDAFRTDPRAYYERFLDGYEPLLSGRGDDGPPDWLQSMFLYECQWLLPVQLTADGRAEVLDDAQRETTLRALAGCARYVSEKRLFEYDATALPLESRLLLQLLAGRPLPPWIGSYASHSGGGMRVSTPVTAGAGIRLLDEGGRVIAATHVERSTPDYFGQDLLQVHVADVDRVPHRIEVDGRERPVVRARARETMTETMDRHRRATVGVWAIPSRRGDVRVWKPVTDPEVAWTLRLRSLIRVAAQLGKRVARRAISRRTA
ncbi:glycosyltransferase family 2 protein [Microbacterium sp. NPDC091382]|uniref:glycosyltransferase family 2 protein n=1 Tax=Microbacterium sp. NPDC091382 TaxID=3364210 RepID=UPI0037F86B55